MNKNTGLTLIELLITLTVAAILMAIAVPGFQDFFVRSRLTGYTNDFMASIGFARSEAIRRGKTVSLCKSSNGSSCGGNWSDGWIVFVNLDNDSPAAVDVGEDVLRVHGALASTYTLNANNNFTNYLTYSADGSANNIGTFVVCHASDEVGARSITLTRMRPRVGTDSNGNGIPEKVEGNNATDIGSCENP